MQTALLVLLAIGVLASGAVSVLLMWDKRQARLGRWRVPEARLHVLEFLGGWPASWLVRRWVRHKTRKVKYRVWFWLAAVGHVGVVAGVVWVIRRAMAGV